MRLEAENSGVRLDSHLRLLHDSACLGNRSHYDGIRMQNLAFDRPYPVETSGTPNVKELGDMVPTALRNCSRLKPRGK
jgi:hypothetical protein